MKRQGLRITLNQLHDLIEELENEFEWDGPCRVTDDDRKFQINIINKTPECSDTWEIENNQRKKDKDDGSNVSLSDNPKQLQGEKIKDEHMPASVDKYVDTDNLTKTSLDGASRIDGCRNPQDDSGGASGATKEDTGDCTCPVDLNSKIVDKIFPRIEELCNRVDNENVTDAYMIAFEIGLKEDIQDALDSK